MGNGRKKRDKKAAWKRATPVKTRAKAKNDSSASQTNDTSANNAQNQSGRGPTPSSSSGDLPQNQPGLLGKKFKGSDKHPGASGTDHSTDQSVKPSKKVKTPKNLNSGSIQKNKKKLQTGASRL